MDGSIHHCSSNRNFNSCSHRRRCESSLINAHNEAAAAKMIDEMALEELRKARDLTQEQLATAARQSGGRLENGTPLRYVHRNAARCDQGHGWQARDPGCLPQWRYAYQSPETKLSHTESTGRVFDYVLITSPRPAFFRPARD